jgi:hypothetical protein
LILAMLLGGVIRTVLPSVLDSIPGVGSSNPFSPTPQYNSPLGPGGGFDTGPPGFSGPSGFRGPSGMRGFPGYPR